MSLLLLIGGAMCGKGEVFSTVWAAKSLYPMAIGLSVEASGFDEFRTSFAASCVGGAFCFHTHTTSQILGPKPISAHQHSGGPV